MSKKAAIIKHFLNTSRDSITLNMMQILNEMDFEVELATDQRSDLKTYWKNSGRVFPLADYKTQLPFTINDTFIYERLLTMLLALRLKVDLAIDVHGDLPPYILRNGTPLVVYLLWPVTAYLKGYALPNYSKPAGRVYLYPFKLFGQFVLKLIPNPFYLVAITNYVKTAIKEVSGLNSHVIYPPVDVSSFSNVMGERPRDKSILVLARISPEKQIERAIRILQLVNAKDHGWQLVITGGLSPFNKAYYEMLLKQIGDSPVLIKPNATKDEVIATAARSSVYLHTMPGEHFGISVVEAMAAGTIPIVPDSGGPTEFVPRSLHYRSEQEAAELIVKNGDVPENRRREISNSTEIFSEESFRNNFKTYLHRIGF